MQANEPSSSASPQGRRVLVAVVTGEAGDVIQAWRTRHDPAQARRIPPHVTLCYWVPDVASELLDAQVVHAFPRSIPLRLEPAARFDTGERSMYLPVGDTGSLDEARDRLYDGSKCNLGQAGNWPWHVTCVRDSSGRSQDDLDSAVAELPAGLSWTLDTVSCLALRGERYEAVQSWNLAP